MSMVPGIVLLLVIQRFFFICVLTNQYFSTLNCLLALKFNCCTITESSRYRGTSYIWGCSNQTFCRSWNYFWYAMYFKSKEEKKVYWLLVFNSADNIYGTVRTCFFFLSFFSWWQEIGSQSWPQTKQVHSLP